MEQGLEDLFCKGPDSKYFRGFSHLMVSVATTQPCSCGRKAAIEIRKRMGCVLLGFFKYRIFSCFSFFFFLIFIYLFGCARS